MDYLIVRAEFMRWIYLATQGRRDRPVRISDFVESDAAKAFTRDEISDAVSYLDGKGLIERTDRRLTTSFANVKILAAGVDAVEDAMRRPDQRPAHFAPWATINQTHFHGPLIGTQVQIGSHGSTQRGDTNITVTIEQVRDFIGAARVLSDVVVLSAETRADLADDLASMERELARTEPRRHRLAELGRTVRNVLEQGIAALAATELSPHLHKAIEAIGSIDWSTFVQ